MKKRHLTYCHTGLLSVEEFCQLEGLTYVGALVYKDTDEIAFDIGEVVLVDGNYYATEISFITKNNLTVSTLKCSRKADFNLKDFIMLDDCNILIDIWNTSIADDGPIWSLAFEDSSLARAQKRIKKETDVDIMVKEYLLEKHVFMSLSPTSLLTPVTSKSA